MLLNMVIWTENCGCLAISVQLEMRTASGFHLRSMTQAKQSLCADSATVSVETVLHEYDIPLEEHLITPMLVGIYKDWPGQSA